MFFRLKNLLFFRISDEAKLPFGIEICRINILSAKVTALVLILTSLVFTVVYFISNHYSNFLIELMFITLFIITSAYYFILDRLSKNIEKHLGVIKLISYIYFELVLIGAAAFSAYHQDKAVFGLIYMALIFIISFCFYCDSVKLFLIFGISHMFYTVMSFFINGVTDLFFTSTILTGMYVTVSYILSRLTYRSKYYEYVTKVIIQQKNEQLSRLNAELMESNSLLKKLSYTDSLTGLNNRRHMNEILQIEWKRCRKAKCPLTLLMIDIDNFKALNDLFGHPVGDDCLQQVAVLMKQFLDDSNAILARYGGEEFLVALPCINEQQAFSIAEQLRSRVEKHMFVWRGHGAEIVITISIGVASVVPSDEYSIDDLIYSADKSMYKAKEKKNQTIILPVQKSENKQKPTLIAKS